MDKKETIQLAVMKTEIKLISKQMDCILPKIDEIHDTFIRGEGKIHSLEKEVFGNGKPGIRTEINKLTLLVEKKFSWYAGAIAFASIIFTIVIQLLLRKYGG